MAQHTTEKLELRAEHVTKALASAKEGLNGIHHYADKQVPGLHIRVRGRTATWLVKTKTKTTTLGPASSLKIREARDQARAVLAGASAARKRGASTKAPPRSWTFGEMLDHCMTIASCRGWSTARSGSLALRHSRTSRPPSLASRSSLSAICR